MPYQDNEPIPDNYTREWMSDISQRVNEDGNLMWEKQGKRDIKAGKEPTPILNFPAGGYWKYSAINKDGPLTSATPGVAIDFRSKDAPIFYKVPEIFTHFTKQKDYEGKAKGFPGVKNEVVHSRAHLEKLEAIETKRKFDEFLASQFSDEEEQESFEQEVQDDWTRGARFEGDRGFIATQTREGGALPGSLMDTAPAGYYWKQDDMGNDIWEDGRRVPAPLYEGKGLTRSGKVATHLQTYGRSGMYGGEEQIKQQLQETYIQNNSYIGELARKYTPDITGANTIPPQTPLGEEDETRGDGTKLTRDYTADIIGSVNPEDYTIGDPLVRWSQSSEAKAIEVEREREFNKLMEAEYQAEVEEHKGTPLEGRTIPWTALGIRYGGNAHAMNIDWIRAKGIKRDLYDLYEAQHLAAIRPALNQPGAEDVGGLVVQMNGVVLDDRGRPTGDVVAAPQDDLDSDIDSDEEDLMAQYDNPQDDDEMNVEQAEQFEDEELQDDANTYGRRITSGTGRQTKWDAGAKKFVEK